jgi:hypothetical protein
MTRWGPYIPVSTLPDYSDTCVHAPICFVSVAVERVGPFAYRAVLAFPRRRARLKQLVMGMVALPDAWIHR